MATHFGPPCVIKAGESNNFFILSVLNSFFIASINLSAASSLKACETKSGRPELYHYETKEIYYKDDEVVEVCDDYDHVEVVCIF